MRTKYAVTALVGVAIASAAFAQGNRAGLDVPASTGVPEFRDPKTRSEEHTSELQSPLIISYAVFCLKK